MKLLIIGIDGGTKEILDHMPMPFTHQLFGKAKSFELSEDLLSRGWAEILTGKHGSETNGFYLMPFCDGSYRFSKSFGMKDMLDAPGVKPLWKLLNERGYSAGFLNVPTTGPAPPLDGFMVSGGGGGITPGEKISPEMVWPRTDSSILDKHAYVFDIRLRGADSTFSDFVAKINAAQEAQKRAFLELQEKHHPDFGFYCFRITTELQYMAMSEIQAYIEESKAAKKESRPPQPATSAQRELENHYSHMDICIKELFDQCNPEHFLFVGDHSTACFTHEANLDVVLAEAGYFIPKSDITAKLEQLGTKITRRTNALASQTGAIKKLRPYRTPPFCFNKKRTKAFSTFFETGNFAGIYINDKPRFAGPISSTRERTALIHEICTLINTDNRCQNLGFFAEPYRDNFASTPYQDRLPDIRVQKPDEILVTSREPELITNNPNFAPLPEYVANLRYPHSGIKGRNPIFIASTSIGPILEHPFDNLTAAYRIVESLFPSN